MSAVVGVDILEALEKSGLLEKDKQVSKVA